MDAHQSATYCPRTSAIHLTAGRSMRRNINPHGVTYEHYQLAEVAQQRDALRNVRAHQSG